MTLSDIRGQLLEYEGACKTFESRRDFVRREAGSARDETLDSTEVY